MNEQAISPVQKASPGADKPELAVEEIFYTIQGEGPFAGQPACFIRLSGCTLCCSLCVIGTTRIAMPGRNKLINQLVVGDWVFSFNQKTQSIEPKQIIKLMKREVVSLIRISRSGGKPLYITEEHLIFVKGRGWVEARNIAVGDVLFHITPSDKMTLYNPSFDKKTVAKGIETKRSTGAYERAGKALSDLWKNEMYGQHVRERMLSNNPMKDENIRKKSWTNREHYLSSIERQVLRVIETHQLPIKFVGDGSFWIGAKCPDFQVVGANKVIEVWDRTHAAFMKRGEDYKRERSEYFGRFGYACLFLEYNQSDFRSPGDPKGAGKEACERWILESLVEFLHNGELVVGIELISPTTQPKAYVRLAGSLRNLIPVYNIEVEDNNNYFANTILVHNCDTNYSTFLPYTVERAASQAERLTPPIAELCVITGGEPFRQYHLIELVERLLKRFAVVQIETSGSCYQTRFDELKWKYGNRISVVCSPKTVKLHKGILRWIDAYKYVVRAGAVADDGLPDEEPQHFKKVKVARPKEERQFASIPVYVQPWDEHDAEKNSANMVTAVASCLQHGYRLSLQLHKIANLP